MSISGRITRGLKRGWIPLLLIIVLAVSAVFVSRLHKIFGSADLNANAGAGIKIVQFNPKVVDYYVDGSPGSTASLNYWDAEANTNQVNNAPLPWHISLSTTLPSVSANIMVQGDGSRITCKITIDGHIHNENKDDQSENQSEGVNPQTFCLVKSA
jgi:Mycobacterium membrane protein